MTTSPGLRERKKAETRRAVHKAALTLVTEHGFDNVTVEEIADAANISRRTFFNYFSDKADALLYGEEERHRALLELLRARPAAEPGFVALRAATLELYGRFGHPDREWVVRTLLARRHPSLLAGQLARIAALERELAQALAERDGDAGVRPRIVAAAYLATLRASSNLWLDDNQARTITEVLAEGLDTLASPFV